LAVLLAARRKAEGNKEPLDSLQQPVLEMRHKEDRSGDEQNQHNDAKKDSV
jgi:hypothetical protein